MRREFEPFAILLFPLYVYGITDVRPIVQNVWPSDLFLIADAGARILEGMRPHADYFSALGVLTQALVAGGLWFANWKATGVFDAANAFAVMAACWLYLRGRALNLPWYLALAPGFLAIEFVVPLRPIGFSPGMITTMGLYNRIGWVLLAAIFLEVVQALSAPPRKSAAIVVGALLSLLLATKINIFGAGLVLAVPLAWSGPGLKRRLVHLIGAGAVVTLIWAVAFRIPPAAFLKDTVTVVTAMPTSKKLELLKRLVHSNAREFAFDLLFLALWVGPAWREGRRARIISGLGLFATTIVAALATGVGSIAGNELLLSFLTPLVALVYAPAGWRRNSTIGLTMVFLALPTVRMNLESYALRRGIGAAIDDPDLYQTISSPRAAGIHFSTWPNQIGVARIAAVARARTFEPSPAGFAMQVSAAMDLIGHEMAPETKLLTLMGEQWMSYLAGLRHVAGDYLFLQVDRVNTRPLPTDVSRVVGGADLVLTPKNLNDRSFYGNEFYVREEFQSLVEQLFEISRENDYWTLWTKRQSAPQGGRPTEARRSSDRP